MTLTQPPFRADHVGSLLRPPELARARAEHKAGRLSSTDLRKAEDVAIRDVVKMQEELGLAGITDGEFRRSSWHMDFLYQIGGVRRIQQNITVHFTATRATWISRPRDFAWKASCRSTAASSAITSTS